jgi:hypothetical protein
LVQVSSIAVKSMRPRRPWRSLAYHSWLFEPRDAASTYVVMEETGGGASPRKLAAANPGHMHRGHDLWNISLKFLCESTGTSD